MAKKISQSLAIVCLILNLIIPGVGTLVGKSAQKKNIKNGIWQLVILVVGWFLSATGTILAFLVLPVGLAIIGWLAILGTWIWALIDSITIIKESI